MAVSAKNNYPKAIPCHSIEELAFQNSRLNQSNDELAAQARRLNQRNEELAAQAASLRRWTFRLSCFSAGLALVTAGAGAFLIYFPNVVFPATPPAQADLVADNAKEAKPAAALGLVKANLANDQVQAKKAPLDLPAKALAKPDASPQDAGFLEALGGLSANHLYQTHLNIGLLADGVESETYTVAEAEKNLKSVVDLMKLVDSQLAKVTKSGIDREDQESIAQIQAVNALLHLQITSLRAYWADGNIEQAAQYHKARNAAGQGLTKVIGD